MNVLEPSSYMRAIGAATMAMMLNQGTPPSVYGQWLQRNPGRRAKAKQLRKRVRAGKR